MQYSPCADVGASAFSLDVAGIAGKAAQDTSCSVDFIGIAGVKERRESITASFQDFLFLYLQPPAPPATRPRAAPPASGTDTAGWPSAPSSWPPPAYPFAVRNNAEGFSFKVSDLTFVEL